MNTQPKEQALRRFFREYESRMNQALGEHLSVDVEAAAAAFADFFVEASPQGVHGGKNDEQFCEMIPKGFAFYRSIGTASMNIISLDITPLDDFHFMNTVHWKATYKRQDGKNGDIEFDVIYFVQVITDQPRIFAYITGDEQRIYQEHGLTPET